MQTADPAGVMPSCDLQGNLGEFDLPLGNLLQAPGCLLMFCACWYFVFFDQHQWKGLPFSFYLRVRPCALVNWVFSKIVPKVVIYSSGTRPTFPSYICAVVSTVDTPWLQYEGHKGSGHRPQRSCSTKNDYCRCIKEEVGSRESMSVTVLGLQTNTCDSWS